MTVATTTRKRRGSSNAWERQVARARSIPIQKMCERLDVELVQHDDDKEGESWCGTCPICEDLAPGFHVSPQKAGGRGPLLLPHLRKWRRQLEPLHGCP